MTTASVAAVLHAAGGAHPWWCALVATGAWLLVRAGRGRYTSDPWGRRDAPARVARDWLTLIGVLAVLHVLLSPAVTPAVAFAALVPSALAPPAFRWAVRRPRSGPRAGAARRVLVVAEAEAADDVVARLARRTDHPFAVVGLCVPRGGRPACGVPVRAELDRPGAGPPPGDADAVLAAAGAVGADLVFVVPGRWMAGDRLRRLSWALYDTGRPLVVLPGLTQVARRRVRVSTAAGLTLVLVSPPARGGPSAVAKVVIDRVGAALLLVALAPLLAALALAVRLSSPGPVLHRQVRIGQHRRPFRMWKFRTMVQDAERLKAELVPANEREGPIFKMRRDPRVTRVGRLLRRSSLDELPQLVNVLAGQMSLVGPRPPLPEEVARYTEVELRRLLVKPGLTGVWQVSGRSELPWDETVALDLGYVDNWSLGWDADLLARTVRAVIDGRGAY
ncbi:exopolysaccharide biosynthesis polyprenyl glycosylphosphotransferase [Wenjunlia vitaminophila]|uniref:exopolysaccharide biosynthesis polyprenyl glycosylphosphotransferase n=1 Tax=Wenjunlia vitaminophila TaxID=76728 RepID=UPI0003626D1F|nr:exopolysaccharide biosynthesis polyprenyl glycosylphosphotransferase [Wenjunlia vitaminophila]